jgi:short-subunit dehydrogenase involved in D-alanine esterification of teichoic acids
VFDVDGIVCSRGDQKNLSSCKMQIKQISTMIQELDDKSRSFEFFSARYPRFNNIFKIF